MKLVVGCPVRDRAWILPEWFGHVTRACKRVDVEPVFVFVAGTSTDATLQVLASELQDYEHYLGYSTETVPVDTRYHQWDHERFHEMTGLRNDLLALCRNLAPDYFLSVDSDILVHEDAIANLIQTAESQPCGAVGGKLYMQPEGSAAPSYALYRGMGGLDRPDSDGVFQVDIIMALKLMKPAAYHVDYQWSHHGEDAGWSMACRDAGLKLWWDGRLTNKHVMMRHQLYEIDGRCGY